MNGNQITYSVLAGLCVLFGCGILAGFASLLLSRRPLTTKAPVLFGLLLLIYLSGHWYRRATAEIAYTEHSPDGRFSIIAYRIPMFWCPPGSGSDASGFVRLFGPDGKFIRQADIESMQTPLYWDSSSVTVGHYDSWPLANP